MMNGTYCQTARTFKMVEEREREERNSFTGEKCNVNVLCCKEGFITMRCVAGRKQFARCVELVKLLSTRICLRKMFTLLKL